MQVSKMGSTGAGILKCVLTLILLFHLMGRIQGLGAAADLDPFFDFVDPRTTQVSMLVEDIHGRVARIQWKEGDICFEVGAIGNGAASLDAFSPGIAKGLWKGTNWSCVEHNLLYIEVKAPSVGVEGGTTGAANRLVKVLSADERPSTKVQEGDSRSSVMFLVLFGLGTVVMVALLFRLGRRGGGRDG